MTAFRRAGRGVHTVKVPTESGVWVSRSTRTRDRLRAKAMQHMIDVLGPDDRGAWDLVRLVTVNESKTKRPNLTLPQLFDLWASAPVTRHAPDGLPIAPSDDERMRHVRAHLKTVDVSPLVDDFFKVLTGPSEGVGDDTAKHYRSAVRLFVPKDETVLATKFSEREITAWLEEMDDVEPGTVRKRGVGLHRFIAWLRDRGVLQFDPMAEITLPSQGPPLAHFLEVPDVERLADTQDGAYRLLSYVLPATAMEVSTALSVRVRSVSRTDRTMHAPGTKTYNRDRVVRVAEFAWDAVLELLKGKHPDTRLFDLIPDRWTAGDAHTAARDALVEAGHRVFAEMPGGAAHLYTMRDHRHTWAVRAVRSGWPIEAVARQLGHVNGILALKVYARFVPRQDEINKWELMATARDAIIAQEAKARGAQ
jgi:integrase